MLSYRIKKEGTEADPQGIRWHLGGNATDFPEALGSLDIVVMTGCTIVNDSYRDILALCRNAEVRGIYGPSCELCPDYLFDLGYNYIFSASVRDQEAYLAAQLARLLPGKGGGGKLGCAALEFMEWRSIDRKRVRNCESCPFRWRIPAGKEK